MTQTKRIFWNVVATYFRSLYSLAVGLFCGRWTLMALGEVDYGLMGVVGGLTVFISFFNGILASAISRFYAFAVGAAQNDDKDGVALDECRHWFNTALMVHLVVPIFLIAVGYPIGVWAIRNFLTIPPDRVSDCVWVFRFVCVSCFVGMINVPYQAMYTAKQYIAELTIYSFVTTTLNAVILYYMVSHPGVWLAKFALFTCLLSVVPQLIICLRARIIFRECRIRFAYWGDWKRLGQILNYAGWQFFGVLGSMLRGQGIVVLVNKYFGARANAGMAIGGAVNGHTATLSSSMMGAFAPAITNACGAGDYDTMRKLSYRTCKLGVVFILLFAIPLSLEVDEVLRLWLKNPPLYASGFCLLMMLLNVVDNISTGHMLAINAKGKIALYQFVVGTALMLSLPLAWMFAALGFGPYSVTCALIILAAVSTMLRVFFARRLVEMSASYWLSRIVLPIVVVSVISYLVGFVPTRIMDASFVRVVITTIVAELVFIPLTWRFVFNDEERKFANERIIRRFKRW